MSAFGGKADIDWEAKSPFVFAGERGAPFSKCCFQAMVERAAKAAGFDTRIHPHTLRHSSGCKLANDGVDTRTIQSYLGQTHAFVLQNQKLSRSRPQVTRAFIASAEGAPPCGHVEIASNYN